MTERSSRMRRGAISARRVAFCLVSAAGLWAPGATFAQGTDAAVEVLTIIGEAQAAGRAATSVRLYQRAPCGSAPNSYFCFQLAQFDTSPFISSHASTPALTFQAPGPGRVVVTWQGTAFCSGYPRLRGVERMDWEIALNVQVQDSPRAVPYNAPGATTIGERRTMRDFVLNYFTVPLTVTRTFQINAAGPKQYFLRAYAEFREVQWDDAVQSICNINGGSMTAVFCWPVNDCYQDGEMDERKG